VPRTGSGRSRATGATLANLPPSTLVLGSILSIQFGLASTGSCFDRFGVAGATALRTTFAAVIVLAFVRPSLRRPRADLGAAALYGLVLGLVTLAFALAIARVPLGVVVSIALLGPLATALLGSQRRLDVVWVVAALGGVLLLVDPFGAR